MRDPTPDSSDDDDSAESAYCPSPKVQPTRLRRFRQATTEELSISPPLIDIKAEPISPSHSIKGKPKTKGKAKPKQGGGRKGEPRRTQNMVAQKKYRDKRVKAAYLVCPFISVLLVD
jgi:hypothetical protein